MPLQSPIYSQALSVYYLSEQAVTVEFGNEISDVLLHRISSFNERLQQNPFPGLQTTVPAYTTLSVFYDALTVLQATHMPGRSCFEKVQHYLLNLGEKNLSQTSSETPPINIPVCYGDDFGPDIADLASQHNLTTQQVINLHTQAIYTVYMIGFVPGFAYMGGLNEQLATPRKATPRQTIPFGSVGIADKQTGIYPLDTPGGWQIIGRTPLKLFDATRSQPSLLKAGNLVNFKSISPQEFDMYSA
ncbi:5-oxoprolinase subunit PxpB [Mucilaginibacter terrae]|uniref:Inhibitor of KinA n=1 Tax=Mucilaginibacter terrae TaxID=1955052 RepID=A0ABU3GPF2_9SPHI|nr:5-oxoprolinase subunit PxpB [Mucilaginibacter terrae]MDT3401669.1 inhibitor of KinA [Mucilaginibacter terrae]